MRMAEKVYDDSMTAVRSAEGNAGSPVSFVLVMDWSTDEIRQFPWILMSADDVLICTETKGRLRQDWTGEENEGD